MPNFAKTYIFFIFKTLSKTSSVRIKIKKDFYMLYMLIKMLKALKKFSAYYILLK